MSILKKKQHISEMLVRLQLTFYPRTFQFEFSFQLEMLYNYENNQSWTEVFLLYWNKCFDFPHLLLLERSFTGNCVIFHLYSILKLKSILELQDFVKQRKKIKPPHSSNLGEATEGFCIIFICRALYLTSIGKGHHLTGKQGIIMYDTAFAGANVEHLADFPGKSNVTGFRQLCRRD